MRVDYEKKDQSKRKRSQSMWLMTEGNYANKRTMCTKQLLIVRNQWMNIGKIDAYGKCMKFVYDRM